MIFCSAFIHADLLRWENERMIITFSPGFLTLARTCNLLYMASWFGYFSFESCALIQQKLVLSQKIWVHMTIKCGYNTSQLRWLAGERHVYPCRVVAINPKCPPTRVSMHLQMDNSFCWKGWKTVDEPQRIKTQLHFRLLGNTLITTFELVHLCNCPTSSTPCKCSTPRVVGMCWNDRLWSK